MNDFVHSHLLHLTAELQVQVSYTNNKENHHHQVPSTNRPRVALKQNSAHPVSSPGQFALSEDDWVQGWCTSSSDEFSQILESMERTQQQENKPCF